MPTSRPWTRDQIADLKKLTKNREDGWRIDWKALKRRFPRRTRAAIAKQMVIQGFTVNKFWTRKEDKTLKDYWNERQSFSLLLRLPGRTMQGIYDRARKLGLYAGVPQGMVSVKSLSLDPKWGYDYYSTIKILKTAGVEIVRLAYTSQKHRAGRRYVDETEAQDAAAQWEKNRAGVETVMQAALRLGMRTPTLWEWLTLEGLVSPKIPGSRGGTGRRFMAPPEVYDRVNAKYRRRYHKVPHGQQPPPAPLWSGFETTRMGCARLGVDPQLFRSWLVMDGIIPPIGKKVYLQAPPSVFDAVLARHRPTGHETPVMAAARLQVNSGLLRVWLVKDGLLKRETGKRVQFLAPPEVYDAVTARHNPKGRETPRAASDRLGVKYTTLLSWLAWEVAPATKGSHLLLRPEVYDEVVSRHLSLSSPGSGDACGQEFDQDGRS